MTVKTVENNRPIVANAPKAKVKKVAKKRAENVAAKEAAKAKAQAAKVAKAAKSAADLIANEIEKNSKKEASAKKEAKPLTEEQVQIAAIKAIEGARPQSLRKRAKVDYPSSKMARKDTLTVEEMITCTVRGAHALDIANDVMSFYGSIDNIMALATLAQLSAFANIGKQGAVSLMATIELMKLVKAMK